MPTTSPHRRTSADKPQNGIAGLRHLRHDLLAGLVVSLVSLPLSSGIAIASGAPPIYGIISAVVAGLVFPFVGGAYVTIAGPAAGLAPALVVTMAALGGVGNADHVGAGYPFLLVVIFLVGCLQLLLSALRLARFAAIFPASVVEGMLGAIGLLIIVKSLPMFFGYTGSTHAHEFHEYLAELPTYVAGADRIVSAIAVSSLVLMFVLVSPRVQLGRFKLVPPQLLAVLFGAALAAMLQGSIDSKLFIQVPANPFGGMQLPAFSELWHRVDLWHAALVGVVTLTLIDGVESLATALAIDRIDPFRRKSQPNRLLAAMGLSNILSSLVGGLTIIPGGVKSKTNIAAGGRTLWANFANALCLLAFLFIAPQLISMIPKAVLGAVLVFTGWKMCQPSIARHLAHIGREQLVFYAFTIAAVLATDLLWGIIAGTLLELAYGAWLCARVAGARRALGLPGSLAKTWADMFRSPVRGRSSEGSVARIELAGPVVSFNAYRIGTELDALPPGTTRVELVFSRDVLVVDHTACDIVVALTESSANAVPVVLLGMERLQPLCAHDKAVRVHPACTIGTGGVPRRQRDPGSWSDATTAALAAGIAAIASPTLVESMEPAEAPLEIYETDEHGS